MRDAAGAELVLEDRVDPWRVAALHATLDLPGEAPAPGAALPPLWHFILFREARPDRELGDDGHPKPGGFLPDTGLPRRMWAGGRFEFHRPLRVGEKVRRVSVIQNMAVKQGSSGSLAFVTVRHEIAGEDGPAIREEQDIVYRAAPDPAKPAPTPPVKDDTPAWTRAHRYGPAALFRFSALTFNAHRIHYDADYAREVEGYPGLVVHGPLLALLMMSLWRENSDKPLRGFSFRGVAPVFGDTEFSACGRSLGDRSDLWILGEDGRLRMTGEVSHG